MAWQGRRRALIPLGLTLAAIGLIFVIKGHLGVRLLHGLDDGPESIELVATIRDFRAYEQAGGHADFQRFSGTTRVGLVADRLDDRGKPVLADRMGWRIEDEYEDNRGRAINPSMYDAALGDSEGRLSRRSDARISSESSFASWFNDTPGVNVSTTVTLKLVRDRASGAFVFDSDIDPTYRSRGGFFPINDQLFGNYGNTGRNFHFTTELRTTFLHQRGAGYVFTFTGDDDVWVFIDGRLVIDLGSLHPKRAQTLELDRLEWLEHGKNYTLDVFHAERRTSQSNFRIETTLPLVSEPPPAITAPFD